MMKRRNWIVLSVAAVCMAGAGAAGVQAGAAGVQAGAAGVQAGAAREILDTAGVKGGLVVQLGCGKGRLTAALRANDAYVVQGLDGDERRVAEARKHIASLGLSGSVSVKHWTRDFLPYADNLVNLFVCEDLGDVSPDEVTRVLAPGGVALVKSGARDWTKTVKPWPEEIDQWTHWLHGPDNNPVAKDLLVGPPRRVQWVATPKWSKSHDSAISMTGMVTAGGRIFYIADDGPVGIKNPQNKLERWKLFARDAFNGVLLWKKPIEDWGTGAWSPDEYPFGFAPWSINPRMIHKRLVVDGNHLYVTLGFAAPISVLDAATGGVLQTLDDTAFASEVLVDGGILYAVVDRAARKAGRRTHALNKSVVAVDPQSGKTLWETTGLRGVEDKRVRGLDAKLARLHLTSGGGKIYSLEDDVIVALDAETGKEAWRTPRPKKVSFRNPRDGHVLNMPWDLGSMLYHDGALYFWQGQIPPNRASIYRIELLAVSAADGEVLWSKICGSATFLATLPRVYAAQGLLWVQSNPPYTPKSESASVLLGLDPKTGDEIKRYPVKSIFDTVHHFRCYPSKATENYLIYSRNGLEYVDLATGKLDINRWVRGICQYGIMPANGLVYSPAQPCACFPSARYNGCYAYSSNDSDNARAVVPADRLHQGPAYGQSVEKPEMTPDDWSIYRRDAHRSGATGSQVPAKLDRLWTAAFNEPITAPTIAMNRVYVATRHTRRVCAVGADDGRRLWSYTVGNLVDTPPTISDGRVFFGTADGHVCCLRASDGALVWRFDANPAFRQIVSYENVESAWPVHGSVVVREGMVYFAAGRSSYLDGGLYFYALDADSGKVIQSTRYHTVGQEEAEQTDRGAQRHASGTANDILVQDAGSICLKNLVVDASTFDIRVSVWSYISAGAPSKGMSGSPISAVGGFLDDSLYDRVGWVLDDRLIAKMMVYNDDLVFGMKWVPKHTLWHRQLFQVGVSEYKVFGQPRLNRTPAGFSDNRTALEGAWEISVPMRTAAMTLTADVLFIAGTPSAVPAADALRAIEAEQGAVLWAVDPANGDRLAEITLEAPPVWDGMAATKGRLYISTTDGTIVCLGGPDRAVRRTR